VRTTNDHHATLFIAPTVRICRLDGLLRKQLPWKHAARYRRHAAKHRRFTNWGRRHDRWTGSRHSGRGHPSRWHNDPGNHLCGRRSDRSGHHLHRRRNNGRQLRNRRNTGHGWDL
jgi:hypothetical protein